MDKYFIASYSRLSQDDGIDQESNSIVNQKQLIIDYICQDKELSCSSIKEYYDDGYTGTNFERPSVKQLLEDVRKGEINCIIVKDLSRFGRQYLQVSKLIEQIFPSLGVRFIAINDGYDSNNYKGSTPDIDVPVRNMLNALYSKDMSKKIKTAKKTKMLNGNLGVSQTIYGYQKSSKENGGLEIDCEAAKVVKTIFNMMIDGNSTFAIAQELNRKGVPTPAMHRKHLRKWNSVNDKNMWTTSSIRTIIRDIRYTGTFVAGMWDRKVLGSTKATRVPKENWIIIPDKFIEIVSKEDFEKANAMITTHKKNITEHGADRLLYKKVKCAACNHLMRFKKRTNPYYFCNTAKYTQQYNCYSEKVIEKDLLSVLQVAIETQLKLIIDLEKIFLENQKAKNLNKVKINRQLYSTEKEVNKINNEKRKLYEAFKQGLYDRTEYLTRREELENRLGIQKNKISELNNQVESQSQDNNFICFFEKFKNFNLSEAITRKVIDELIDTIYIESNGNIIIEFLFRDEYEHLLDKLLSSSQTYSPLIETAQ